MMNFYLFSALRKWRPVTSLKHVFESFSQQHKDRDRSNKVSEKEIESGRKKGCFSKTCFWYHPDRDVSRVLPLDRDQS